MTFKHASPEGIYCLVFSPPEMISITGVAERRFQSWVQRNFVLQATRPGRGVAREYSLVDLLYLSYLRVLTEACVELEEAASYACEIFPHEAFVPMSPNQKIAKIPDIIRAAAIGRPDLAPRRLAIINRQQIIVAKSELEDEDIVAPIPEGKLWAIVVDLSEVVIKTTIAAQEIIARRTVS
jgi:hypothetical protein